MVITYLVTITGGHGGVGDHWSAHWAQSGGIIVTYAGGDTGGVRLYLLLLIIGDIFPH